MRRLWPFFGIAMAVAVGIALAPFVWMLLLLVLALAVLVGVAAVYELVRREFVLDVQFRKPPRWYEALQDRLDPIRARTPGWVFDWRGKLVILSPLWLLFLMVLVLPFVMR